MVSAILCLLRNTVLIRSYKVYVINYQIWCLKIFGITFTLNFKDCLEYAWRSRKSLNRNSLNIFSSPLSLKNPKHTQRNLKIKFVGEKGILGLLTRLRTTESPPASSCNILTPLFSRIEDSVNFSCWLALQSWSFPWRLHQQTLQYRSNIYTKWL